MQQHVQDTLSLWREEGSHLIQQNNQVFRSLLSEAKELAQRGKYDASAVYGQIAASYAQSNHCGFFVSPELERLLLNIGQTAIAASAQTPSFPKNPRKILHVSTITSTYGGIPRLMRRWIQQDSLRSHSVALTRHAPNEVPTTLKDTVAMRQGEIYLLNDRPGGILARAKRLRDYALEADLVVLHTWEYDVIPTIAFANKEQCPPVIYTNHGDHWFWMGASVSDVVANLRESGMRLSEQRRGIEPERNLLLPTILEPAQRTLSRTEAKRQLGIDDNSIVLLSIARAVKYKAIDEMSFADAHVPLLQQYKNAILIVIGPGDHEDWSSAIQQAQGRIRVLGETPDTAVFYQAADIYVDSYPFISITSLLEAGSYDVPSVSRYPYASDACGILGSDMPGLTGNLIRVFNLEEYTKALSQLIEDERSRLALGEATRKKIEEIHWGNGWQQTLNEIYFKATTLPRVTALSATTDEKFLGEPDVYLSYIHRSNIDKVMHWHMSLLPFEQRLPLWLKLVKEHGLHKIPLNLIMPEGLRSRYHQLRSR